MADSATAGTLGGNVEAQPFLKAILDCVAQPVRVVDHAGLIRFANPAAIEALTDQLPLPVTPLELPEQRFPPVIEASVYFLVSEALTNVVKHANATAASIRIVARDGVLTVEVSDDGIGVSSRIPPAMASRVSPTASVRSAATCSQIAGHLPGRSSGAEIPFGDSPTS
jgi:hypothetical protein